jgi:hypothetical protein
VFSEGRAAMAEIPDDILKSIEVATKANVDAISFDGQILDDNLKYSNWMSALAIASLLMIASNFSDLVPASSPKTLQIVIILLAVVSLLAGIASGGIYHRQVISELENKRIRVTFLLKQHSIMLASPATFQGGMSLCEQIWAYAFLGSSDKAKIDEIKKAKEAQKGLLIVQGILLALGILFVFTALFLSAIVTGEVR